MREHLPQVGLALALAVLLAAPALVQGPDVSPLASQLPSGAMLVVEVKDFGELWKVWNASAEKAAWTAGDNYKVFSRSKLVLRLKEAQAEFAAAAGLAPDLALLNSVAGAETAMALYDVGDLRLVYVTELSRARALETALMRSQASFEPRQAAGRQYFVRRDEASGREAAFAAGENRLYIATDAALLGRALELAAGADDRSLADEAWYREAIAAAPARGEVRLVENLRSLTRSPHFRSYWIQGNITALTAYGSAVADLSFAATEAVEKRRLLRAEATEQAVAGDLGELLRLAPPRASLYRAWLEPTPAQASELLRRKLLAPYAGTPGAAHARAPGAPSGAGTTGSEGDLERRIDQPPARVSRPSYASGEIAELLNEQPLTGLLHVETGGPAASSGDQILTAGTSLIALRRTTPWDEGRVQAALRAAAGGLWTTSGHGTTWRPSNDGSFALDGLKPLFMAVREGLLFVSDSSVLMTAALSSTADPSAATDASYAAGFRHALEAERYRRVMGHLDYMQSGRFSGTNREPHLFSENIGSLSQALERVATVEVESVDRGVLVEQTVRYRFR